MEYKRPKDKLNTSYNMSVQQLDQSTPPQKKESNADFANSSITQDLSNAYKGTKGFLLKTFTGKTSEQPIANQSNTPRSVTNQQNFSFQKDSDDHYIRLINEKDTRINQLEAQLRIHESASDDQFKLNAQQKSAVTSIKQIYKDKMDKLISESKEYQKRIQQHELTISKLENQIYSIKTTQQNQPNFEGEQEVISNLTFQNIELEKENKSNLTKVDLLQRELTNLKQQLIEKEKTIQQILTDQCNAALKQNEALLQMQEYIGKFTTKEEFKNHKHDFFELKEMIERQIQDTSRKEVNIQKSLSPSKDTESQLRREKLQLEEQVKSFQKNLLMFEEDLNRVKTEREEYINHLQSQLSLYEQQNKSKLPQSSQSVFQSAQQSDTQRSNQQFQKEAENVELKSKVKDLEARVLKLNTYIRQKKTQSSQNVRDSTRFSSSDLQKNFETPSPKKHSQNSHSNHIMPYSADVDHQSSLDKQKQIIQINEEQIRKQLRKEMLLFNLFTLLIVMVVTIFFSYTVYKTYEIYFNNFYDQWSSYFSKNFQQSKEYLYEVYTLKFEGHKVPRV